MKETGFIRTWSTKAFSEPTLCGRKKILIYFVLVNMPFKKLGMISPKKHLWISEFQQTISLKCWGYISCLCM